MSLEPRFGCHVDLADDEEPDGCVIEYGGHGDCIFATFAGGRKRRKPHTCPHWRAITPHPAKDTDDGDHR